MVFNTQVFLLVFHKYLPLLLGVLYNSATTFYQRSLNSIPKILNTCSCSFYDSISLSLSNPHALITIMAKKNWLCDSQRRTNNFGLIITIIPKVFPLLYFSTPCDANQDDGEDGYSHRDSLSSRRETL